MKFELNEDTLLRVSGAGALAYSAFALAAPKPFHETFMAKSNPLNEEAWRYMGAAGCMLGGDHLLIASSDASKATKKDMCKIAGAGWVVLGGLNALNCKNETQPREIAITNAVGQAVLGGLLLWKGFE